MHFYIKKESLILSPFEIQCCILALARYYAALIPAML